MVLLSLTVDIKKDDLGVRIGHALEVTLKRAVANHLLDKEIERRPLLLAGLANRMVGEQVRKDLDEVRLTRSEEAGNPDAHSGGDFGVPPAVDSLQEGIDEPAQMPVDLLGDHILFEFVIG